MLLLLVFLVGTSALAVGADPPRWAMRSAPIFRLVASGTADDSRMAYTSEPIALAQDGTGFIWIGTTAGLERWDGYRMRTYTARPGDACALPDERVSTLFVDEQQRLWIGTLRGDIALYDPTTDCTRTIVLSSALNQAIVESLTTDGEGGLWIGSRAGLWHLAADLKRLTQLTAGTGEEERLNHERVSRVLRDRRGALWVGGNMGLQRRGPSDAHFVSLPLPPDVKIRALIESTDGRIWVGTVAHGAFVIEPSTLRVRPVADILRSKPIPLLLRAAETPTGEIWFGTTSAGIIAVDPASLSTRVIHHQKGVTSSLVDDSVQDLIRDRTGLVWVVTGAGLGYFNTRTDISTILIADELNGLPEGAIDSMTRLRDDRIAIGFGNQIALLGPRGTGTMPVPVDLQPEPQLVLSLATSNGRDLLAAMLPNGLAWIDLTHARARYIPLTGPSATQHLHAVMADGDRLWVGGTEGLWLLVRPPEASPATASWSVAQRFEVSGIESMTTGSGDLRWFGSERGIYRYDGGAAAPKHVQLLDSAGTPLPDLIVSSLHTDRRGRLWIGSNIQGVLVIDSADKSADRVKVVRHFLADLPSGSVRSILEDDAGGIWVAATRGIARIDPETFAVRLLSRGDGIAISNYTAGACATPTCDELLFGGQDGLTLIRPHQRPPTLLPPPVVVTRISIGRQEVPAARFNTNLTDPVLNVPANAQSLAIEFAALDFSDPMHNAYEYQLEGYDAGWVPTGFDTRMASYTNLPPGSYRLRLRGSDHAGTWSTEERQLTVHVAAAWYQTMGFHALEAAALALTVFLIVQARTVILRQRQRELESLVAARTQDLVRATEARTTLIENISHDLRTPLTSLRAYLESLSLKDATLSDADRSQYIGIALRQAKRLGRLVRELFDLIRLDDAAGRLTLERFSPTELVQDVVQEFSSVAEGRSIEFHADPGAESAQLMGDISLIQRLIDNLVDNAVQHTPPGGQITITLSTDDDGHLVLEVRDTGRGIDAADLQRIFNRYERGDTARRTAGAGLGLAIVKRIVDLQSGSITVDSQLGEGTRFTVRLPLNGPAPSVERR